MQWVLLIDTLYKLHVNPNVSRLSNNVGMASFLSIKINGIDMERIMELLSAMKGDGIAQVINEDGDKVEIPINT